jgi:hypothetical protein
VQILQLGLKIPVGKGKYGSRYYNKTPKFQLVEASMNVGIVTKSQNFNW